MAEDLLCNLYEEKVVSYLPRRYHRSNPKLTPTERHRLTGAFAHFWVLLLQSRKTPNQVQTKLNLLPYRNVYRMREITLFLHQHLDARQLREIAVYQGEEHALFNIELFREELMSVLRKLGETGCPGGYPDKAPLGLWSVFDHWQEDMASFDKSRSTGLWKR